MKKILSWFINLCALWIIVAYVIGYFWPEVFLWFSRGRWMTWALAVVMLCMGLSLDMGSFASLFKQPKVVVLAAISQYTVMPLSGYLIALALGLPKELAVGFIIVACCPGGMASNLIAYIGRANLSLSVVSTAISTILGIIMTPFLTKLLAGGYVPVDAWGMLRSVVEIVLIPVALGVFINWKFPDFVKKLGQGGAVISTISVTLVSGAVIAPAVMLEGGREQILAFAGKMFLAATLLHGLGFGLGFALGKIFKYDRNICKAIACETGMQNGGLAATLAKVNFPAYMPIVGVPSIFCSIMQSAIGGILASWWRMTTPEKEESSS
ncbi:MAG: bile acid:sodium symporter family protein [Bacteroidales bacterium]|nr:bile acid:sodium symporter family protein [Bacteroidales bacterium]